MIDAVGEFFKAIETTFIDLLALAYPQLKGVSAAIEEQGHFLSNASGKLRKYAQDIDWSTGNTKAFNIQLDGGNGGSTKKSSSGGTAGGLRAVSEAAGSVDEVINIVNADLDNGWTLWDKYSKQVGNSEGALIELDKAAMSVNANIDEQNKKLQLTGTQWAQLGSSIASTVSNLAGGGDIVSGLTGLINSIGAMTGPVGNIVAAAWNIGTAIGGLIGKLFGKKEPPPNTMGNPSTLGTGIPDNVDEMFSLDQGTGTSTGPTIIVNGVIGNEDEVAATINNVLTNNQETNELKFG